MSAEEVNSKMEEMKVNDTATSNHEDEQQQEEDDVNPWSVSSKSAKGVDYDKLISK